MHTFLLIAGWEHTADQSNDSTQVQLDERRTCIGTT